MSAQLLVPSNRYQKLSGLGNPRTGPDNSALTERGIRAIFYDGLENAFDQTWASRVGLNVPSDTRTETHRWLGQTPAYREWFGSLLAKGLNDFELIIINRQFEDSIEFSLQDFLQDKTGNIVRRIGELGQRTNNHWEELLVTALEANQTAYDAQNYFSASHSSGSSGTLSNLLTSADITGLNVTATGAPTKAEAELILSQMAAYFFRYKDDQGQKSNQGARNFLLLCSPVVYAPFQAAANDLLVVTGGTNELSNLGWTFDIVSEALLGSDTVLYMFRTDAPSSRPYILQEDMSMPPSIEVLGPGSEYTKIKNKVLYSGRVTRNVGPGEWRHAIKGTLS